MPTSVSTPSGPALRQFGSRAGNTSYERFLVRVPRSRLTAHIIRLPPRRTRMTVHVDDEAIGVNFREQQVVDPQQDDYRHRPGFYLHEKLAELIDQRQPAVLLNGNNIGYWANQFVIRKGRLQYKPRGPIFDDGHIAQHAAGDHAFFLSAGDAFTIRTLTLLARQREEGAALEGLWSDEPGLPRYGLSGFPLLSGGRPMWRKHGPLAWDPGLLFDLGRIPHRYTPSELRDHVEVLLRAGSPLARHPMTVIGLDGDRRIVLLVVERSDDSRGITVDEAAELLRRRFAVRDAIVLGAAGDTQVATTEEGVLVEPLVAPHARHTARAVPEHLLAHHLRGRPVAARPVPSYVRFALTGGPPHRYLTGAETSVRASDPA